MIDINLLEKGQSYKALNDTYIIFICTFGVFVGNRHKYTFRNLCMEEQGLALNDGTNKVFLSTKGTAKDISKPLKNFLDYVDGEAPADELMQEIDNEVITARDREEWRREYMTLALELDRKWAEGREEGRTEGILKSIRNLMKNANISADKAMTMLGIAPDDFGKYLPLL